MLFAGFLVLLLFASSQQLFGQGLPVPFFPLQYFTDAGAVCNACTLTSSLTGTATPSPLYQDSTLITPAGTASVVTLDSSGRPSTTLFMDPSITYRLVLKTSAGVTIRTADGQRTSPTTSFSGTSGVIPKFTSTGTSIQDTSCLSESGTVVTVAGSCTLTASIVRPIPGVSNVLTTVTGSPVQTTVTSGGVITVVVGLSSGTNSSVGTQFTVPGSAVTTATLKLQIAYQASTAPGVTNNKVKLTLACQVGGVAASTTAGDTITLANNTVPATYTGTVNIIAASSYSTGSAIDCTILRDVSVANNAAVWFYLRNVDFTFTSSQ